MGKLFFLLVCLFGLFINQSQAQDLFFSKPEKFSFQNSDFSVIGWSGNRLYTYRSSNEGYFLNGYNDSMQLVAKVNLDFFPKKIYDTKFYNYDDRILVFYQAIQSNEVVQYAALLDKNGLLQGRPKVLGSAKTGWFANKKKYFSYSISEDKTKIMVLGWGNKNTSFSTILLDKDLNVLARGNQNLKQENDQSFHQALLLNSGVLYLTTFLEKGAKGYSDEMSVFVLSADAKNLKQTRFPLKDVYLSGLFSKINFVNGELYSAAFYSDKKNGNLQGLAYAVFNPDNNSFSIAKKIPFDEDLLEATEGRNKRKVFNNFEVRQIIIKNNGGFIVNAENAYVTTRTTYPSGYGYYSSYYYNAPFGNTSVREYIFGDILSMSFDGQGNRSWFTFIRKDQYSQDDEGMFSSYSFMNSGGNLGFLFNNFSSRNSALNVAIIDPNGKLDISRLENTNNIPGDWIPKQGKQTDLKEWVIPILRGNNLSFVRLVFN